MGCLYIILALISPRLLLLVLWVFTEYVQPRAFDFFLWPLLGLIFLPWTTLAVTWGYNSDFGPIQIAAIVLAVLADVGSSGGAEKRRRRREQS